MAPQKTEHIWHNGKLVPWDQATPATPLNTSSGNRWTASKKSRKAAAWFCGPGCKPSPGAPKPIRRNNRGAGFDHQNKGGVGFLFWNANNDYSKPYAAMPEMRAAKGQYFRGDELSAPVQASLVPGAK